MTKAHKMGWHIFLNIPKKMVGVTYTMNRSQFEAAEKKK
jgi:hypothetical protein